MADEKKGGKNKKIEHSTQLHRMTEGKQKAMAKRPRTIYSFPPLTHPHVSTLILGTMPSQASLDSRQYYANPRNIFWTLIELIVNIKHELPYEVRCKALEEYGIAVWDVLKTCRRASSLDADIVASSIKTNDFVHFFETYSNITRICFNGATAERLYLRHVRPWLPASLSSITTLRLPSTSPANATLSFEDKLQAWRNIRT